MAEIAPLQALRYRDAAQLERLVAPPYDVIDAAQRAELASRHEHNVVRIDLPEGEGDQRYENARRIFNARRLCEFSLSDRSARLLQLSRL